MTPIIAAISWSSVGIRAAVVAVALVLWFWTQSLIGKKAAAKDGIGDLIHDLTARWHAHLTANPRTANAALIVSSLFIDLFGLALIGAAIFGHTFTPFVAVIVAFSMRQICMSVCTLPPPRGYIWRNPGFPTLLVTYDVGNDLFFSRSTRRTQARRGSRSPRGSSRSARQSSSSSCARTTLWMSSPARSPRLWRTTSRWQFRRRSMAGCAERAQISSVEPGIATGATGSFMSHVMFFGKRSSFEFIARSQVTSLPV